MNISMLTCMTSRVDILIGLFFGFLYSSAAFVHIMGGMRPGLDYAGGRLLTFSLGEINSHF